MHHSRLLPLLTAAFVVVTPAADAAELGEPVVKSHIGQQLVADIELLPDEGGTVRASIAHDDVFRGANIARSPVIDTLTMSVMRRDGKQFLHITSIKPVEAGYLHLYLDLHENGKRKIRPATLWLQPEPPVPAPAPVRVAAVPAASIPAPAPAPAAAAAPGPAPARTSEPVAAAKPAVRQKPSQPDVACQALDYKNAQLTAQIVDLEEKVKALQYAVDMQGTSVPAPAVKSPAPARKAAARPAAKTKSALWPAFAGIGVVALGGGGWWAWRLRRRRSAAVATPPLAET
jgi:Tfp pilus assembly protein FimV